MQTTNNNDMAVATRLALRARVLAARDALAPVERQRLSTMAHANLWQLPSFAAAATVLLYVDFRSEVATMAMIHQCLEAGKTVAVPRVAADHRLITYQLTAPDLDLIPGSYGILEPNPARCATIDPQAIKLVVLPGSVFDEQGGRLGYGGGYYDRFLANAAPRAVRLGLAFELQVVPVLPLLAHDQRLHGLITESRTLAFPA
jgi:5-formyltetrahydrofolate cyclo-ligase